MAKERGLAELKFLIENGADLSSKSNDVCITFLNDCKFFCITYIERYFKRPLLRFSYSVSSCGWCHFYFLVRLFSFFIF